MKSIIKLVLILFPIMAFCESELDFSDPLVKAADSGDNYKIVKLIENGHSVDARDKYGITALMRAVIRNNLPIVELLISKDANLNLVDHAGASVSHIAARAGYDNIMDLLIKAGADIDLQDDFGWTPIMRAAAVGKISIIKKLLSAGANLYKKNDHNDDIFTLAAKTSDKQVINILHEYGAFEQISEGEKEKLIELTKDIAIKNLISQTLMVSSPRPPEIKETKLQLHAPQPTEHVSANKCAAESSGEPILLSFYKGLTEEEKAKYTAIYNPKNSINKAGPEFVSDTSHGDKDLSEISLSEKYDVSKGIAPGARASQDHKDSDYGSVNKSTEDEIPADAIKLELAAQEADEETMKVAEIRENAEITKVDNKESASATPLLVTQYVIQYGSSTVEKKMDRLKDKILAGNIGVRKEDFSVINVKSDHISLYKLRSGPYNSKEAARICKNALDTGFSCKIIKNKN